MRITTSLTSTHRTQAACVGVSTHCTATAATSRAVTAKTTAVDAQSLQAQFAHIVWRCGCGHVRLVLVRTVGVARVVDDGQVLDVTARATASAAENAFACELDQSDEEADNDDHKQSAYERTQQSLLDLNLREE